ncbi:cytochrome c oxidase assembly protein PET191-domain-containing protein [Papiliotrema laurentii]|uniref:Cytochrome c oxidase assembly protein PET191-domain-containing protein n=1 Tax=Papiliotrema laurentii TaxID=5418 RepID=A0AAD9CVS2_PAPLA|nr:cytochrome c oxidase assembly protein PET191-domain-containing protein [Papiliotrema laurentii]
MAIYGTIFHPSHHRHHHLPTPTHPAPRTPPMSIAYEEKKPLPCQGPRDELIACVMRSDCFLKQGKSPGECIRNPQQLPLQCQHLISSYADCKKGMLDMRRRFRGNHLSDAEAKASRSADGTGIADIDPTTGERR